MGNTQSIHILVTDKNHHVRDLLVRELEREGHVTYNVASCTSVLSHILSGIRLDLIILDPEIFGTEHLGLFRKIVHGIPSTLVILHTFSDLIHIPKSMSNIMFIPKSADSIQHITSTVQALQPDSGIFT